MKRIIILLFLILITLSCSYNNFSLSNEIDDIYVVSTDFKLPIFIDNSTNPEIISRYNNGPDVYTNYTVLSNNSFSGNPFFWDPFWDSFWGPGFSTWGAYNTFGLVGSWGMGVGWSRGFGAGIGMWNRLTPAWMLGRPGMMWGWDPFMWDMWYNPAIRFYNPWRWNTLLFNNRLIVVNKIQYPIRNTMTAPRNVRSNMYGYSPTHSNYIINTNSTRLSIALLETSNSSRVAQIEREFNTTQNELYNISRRRTINNRTINAYKVESVDSQSRRTYTSLQNNNLTNRGITTNLNNSTLTNKSNIASRQIPNQSRQTVTFGGSTTNTRSTINYSQTYTGRRGGR